MVTIPTSQCEQVDRLQWRRADFAVGDSISYTYTLHDIRACTTILERHYGEILELWLDPVDSELTLAYAEVRSSTGHIERAWFHRDNVKQLAEFERGIGPAPMDAMF
jgi:hypothetical protein